MAVKASPLTDMRLPPMRDSPTQAYDLAIAGAGPAGLVVAARVSAAGYKVCLVDPDPLAAWPNNYGVWVDEFRVRQRSAGSPLHLSASGLCSATQWHVISSCSCNLQIP